MATQRATGATLTGAGEDLSSGGLPPRIALGRGLPGGWPAARKESASTFREAREIKIRHTAEEASRRAGQDAAQLRAGVGRSLRGRGANDVINDRTRREYRRLLIKYALAYFATDTLLRDIDEHGARGFVEWLCRRSDEGGHRLCDRSVRNAVLPLQSCLRHAARCGLLGEQAEPMPLLPRRRPSRGYEFDERRFLTRQQLAGLLAEVPAGWRLFFDLLASTGLRISEAIALRIIDVDLDSTQPRVHVRRDRRRPPHRPEVAAWSSLDPDQRGPRRAVAADQREAP